MGHERGEHPGENPPDIKFLQVCRRKRFAGRSRNYMGHNPDLRGSAAGTVAMVMFLWCVMGDAEQSFPNLLIACGTEAIA